MFFDSIPVIGQAIYRNSSQFGWSLPAIRPYLPAVDIDLMKPLPGPIRSETHYRQRRTLPPAARVIAPPGRPATEMGIITPVHRSGVARPFQCLADTGSSEAASPRVTVHPAWSGSSSALIVERGRMGRHKYRRSPVGRGAAQLTRDVAFDSERHRRLIRERERTSIQLKPLPGAADANLIDRHIVLLAEFDPGTGTCKGGLAGTRPWPTPGPLPELGRPPAPCLPDR
jgi:hypothetical protein